MAFMNGLQNRNHMIALAQYAPASISLFYNLIGVLEICATQL